MDQYLEILWTPPGTMIIQLAAVPTGGEKPPFVGTAVHLLTPETEATTHYFSGGPQRGGLAFVRDPFVDEDGPMLADCQIMMEGHDLWELNPVILPADAAAVHVRRLIEQLLKQERASAAIPAAA